MKNLTLKNKRLIGILLTIGILLLIPFFAMKFTGEVNWTATDFEVAAGLLLVTGLACEFVLRRVTKTGYRIVVCAAILAIFCVVWVQLAVDFLGKLFGRN